MKRIVAGLLASALSLSFMAADIAVANAAPTYIAPIAPATQPLAADVQQVDHRPGHRIIRRDHRGVDRRDFRRIDRRDFRDRRDFHRDFRRDRSVYWRGHRGYRDYRPGYRRHGDYWFPLAAFAAGAIISGAIANSAPPPPPVYSGGNSHVSWCYNRYRSYRASDNTFQPYNGPRRQCVSPYY